MSWIKMRTELARDGRVVRMAARLKVSRTTVVGACFVLWALADEVTTDGLMNGYDGATIDGLVEVPGFSSVMVAEDWLRIEDLGVRIPRFGEHNGASAKARSGKSLRQAAWRAKGSSVDGAASTGPSTPPSTREEKRREEERRIDMKTKPTLPAQGRDDFAFLVEGCLRASAGRSNADEWHRECVQSLRLVGFLVETEVVVPDRGDGRRGKIDISASLNGQTALIELDRISAREKSIRKLLAARCDLRVIGLREGGEGPPIEGILVVACGAQTQAVPKLTMPSIPPALDTPGFRAAWDEWVAFRAERKPKVTSRAARAMLGRLVVMGEKRAREAIAYSMANGWQGIFEEKSNGTTRPIRADQERAAKRAREYPETDELPVLRFGAGGLEGRGT